MGLGQKLKAAWDSAAGEVGGFEHLSELLSRIALLFTGFWVIALLFIDWIRGSFFANGLLTGLMLGGFALGLIDVAMSLQTWIPAHKLVPFVPISVVYL